MIARKLLPVIFVTAILGGLYQDVWSRAATDARSLRVMTFNIRYGTANDGENSWPQRRELLCQTIRAYDPDILTLQEALPLQIDFLLKALPAYQHVGRSREKDNADGEQCAMLLRRARFEIRQSDTFWLSETPQVVGSQSWDASLPRIATWVEVSDRWAAGRLLRCYNVHLDHIGKQSRLESARLVRACVDESNEMAVIVAGDFNAADDSEVHAALIESQHNDARLTNALRSACPTRGRNENTYHGFGGPQPGKPIDWILFNGRLKCVTASINRAAREDRYPSDHFPVQAELRYVRAAEALK